MRLGFAGLALALMSSAAHAEVHASAVSCKLINTAAQLQAINANATTLARSYCLGKDIDLHAIPSWTPIGTLGGPEFTGQFYGRGHVIRNLKIVTSAAGAYGLFGSVNGGMIRDLGLVNVDVRVTGTSGTSVVGALAGAVQQLGVASNFISNVYSTGRVICTGTTECDAGGLLGFVGDTTLTDAWSSADATSSFAAGGLVSSLSAPDTLHAVHATGSATVTAGGIAAGGLVAILSNAGVIRVEQSYATGRVNGAAGSSVGGLIGNLATSAVVSNAYATGWASGGASTNIGGLVGKIVTEASLSQVFSAGKVTAGSGSAVGGLLGQAIGGSPLVISSYWDTSTSGQTTSAGSGEVGRTTAQLRHAMPAGFTGAWGNTQNLSYPYLNDPDNFTSNLATLVRSNKVFTFLPIQQSDESQYLGNPVHEANASLATVYTMIARAVGITDNVASLRGIKIDKTYWHDTTQTTTFAGPVKTHATLGPLKPIAAATRLTNANVIGQMNVQRLVILRGTYKKSNGATATHYMLGTLYQKNGNVIGSVIANDPWTGRQVEISPTTKKVITAGFPLTTFKVNGYRSVTVN